MTKCAPGHFSSKNVCWVEETHIEVQLNSQTHPENHESLLETLWKHTSITGDRPDQQSLYVRGRDKSGVCALDSLRILNLRVVISETCSGLVDGVVLGKKDPSKICVVCRGLT